MRIQSATESMRLRQPTNAAAQFRPSVKPPRGLVCILHTIYDCGGTKIVFCFIDLPNLLTKIITTYGGDIFACYRVKQSVWSTKAGRVRFKVGCFVVLIGNERQRPMNGVGRVSSVRLSMKAVFH